MEEGDKVEYPENSIASALSDALDNAEVEEVEDVQDEQIDIEEPSSEDTETVSADNTEEIEAVESTDQGEEATSPDRVEEEDSAPSSWTPAAREEWKDIPSKARAYIAQREAQMSEGIKKYADNAKRAQQMDQTLAPYQQFLSMNGSPGATIKGLLQTGSILQMGSPAQKAQIVANLITQFGVGIQDLDNLLSGQNVPRETQENSRMEAMINERLNPLQQQLSQYQQRDIAQQNQVQEQIASEVDVFAADANNEFYNDVKMDMADILDMASNRGLNLSMKEAYDRACLMHPEISKIVNARASAKDLPGKRRAAVSITGNPSGPGESEKTPNDMTSQLNAAWDAVGRV